MDSAYDSWKQSKRPMKTTLHFLFDPLCGWCYGATPAVSGLLATPGIVVKLLPTGLFSGEGARPIDDAFAKFAWSNDQRIEHLTGQSFTERYRRRVLGDRQQIFDSGPATVALTAVSRPGARVDAGIQRSRRAHSDRRRRREALDGRSRCRLFQPRCTDQSVGSRLNGLYPSSDSTCKPLATM